MSRKVLLVVHQEHSDPGRVGLRLREMGYAIDIRRTCLGHDLPEAFDDYAGAVVFGGPMSANDDHLPFIRAELEWIPRAVAAGLPFLGICLGAQLLARAAGGAVGPHPEGWHEIGYYPLAPTPAGGDLFPRPMHVFHWHMEGIEAPRSATLLAAGDRYRVQAFQLGANAYGVQFHPEVTREMMERWATKAAHRLLMPGAQPRDRILAGWSRHDGAVAVWLDAFLQRWLAAERAPRAVA